MNQELLFKLSLSVSLLTILLLLFLANTLEPKSTPVQNITNKDLNKKIKIQGTIIKIQNKNDFQIITIQDSTGQISIIANSKIPKNHKSKNITITGTISEYKNNFQINADKIISS